jgi:MoaA/NifB/PqqE/SkfB family radical SAM enzyme
MNISSFAIDITNECNFRCLHCYNSSGDNGIVNNNLNLTDDELKSFFNSLDYTTLDAICFCGGEPLLKFDLIVELCEIIPTTTQKSIVTNGYLLDDEKAKMFKTLGFRIVQISVDGLEETHNYIRNNNESFSKAIEAIKHLVNNKVDVAVTMLPTNKSLYEIEELFDTLYKIGVKNFRVQPFMKLGRGIDSFDALCLNNDQENELVDKIIKIREKFSDNNAIEWGDPSDHLYMYFNENYGYDTIDQIYISNAGEVGISPYLPFSLGNIKNKHVYDIVTSENINNYLVHEDVVSCVKELTDASKFDRANKYRKLYEGKNIIIK